MTLERPPSVEMTPRISVIIPCYLASPWLEDCVASLAAQTLDHALFEAVLVFNGPDDGAVFLAESLLAENGLRHQILHSDPGAPTARNTGTRCARGAWHTFVDVDDQISANYLEALLASAHSSRTIPVATMIDLNEDGTTCPAAVHHQVMRLKGEIPAADLWRPLSITVLKLLPAEVSQRHTFNTALRSGEDVALFFSMFEAEELDFDTTPAHEGATYFRRVREGSVSRQPRSFDFMVTQRLLVMGELEHPLVHAEPRLSGVIGVMIRSQADMVASYVRENPDRLQDVVDAVNAHGLNHFPWFKLPTRVDRLIVSYGFAPFSDPSAVVTLKRSLAAGHRCNAISVDMSDRRHEDKSLRELAEEIVVEHRMVPGPSAFEEWEGIERFCHDGMAALTEIESLQGLQRHVYSRAMFPASHFLGALIKGRRPATHWTAEFSDPLRKNIFGSERPGGVGSTELSKELSGFVDEAGWELPANGTVFGWAEHLAFILADRLVFTNPHQLSYMMGYLNNPDLRERVMDRSVISAQPTLPPAYYKRGRPSAILDPQFIHLAYFGSFYPTRGLGDILAGLSQLSPASAGRLKIHVFTSSMDALAKSLNGHPSRRSVIAYNPLHYLDFLQASTTFDMLLINDARTLGADVRVNPYLPSKLSDYLGSGRPIWGMVEPGSMLSRQSLAYKTPLGDASAAAEVLRTLAEKDQT